jgi:hypothetical protein
MKNVDYHRPIVVVGSSSGGGGGGGEVSFSQENISLSYVSI